MSPVDLALIALGFLVLFLITASTAKSILGPAPLWNLMWFISFITSAYFGRGFIYDGTAMLLLALVAASFNIGCAFVGSLKPPVQVDRPDGAHIPTRYLLGCLLVSAYGLVLVSKDLGTSIFAVHSFGSLLDLGKQNAAALFRGEASLGGKSKLAFSVMQVGFALVGAEWRLRRRKGLAVLLLAFLAVAFLWSAVTTQRSYLLVPIVWWVGGYIAATCWTGRKVVPPRVLVRALAVLFALVFLVVWLRAVRTGGTSAAVSGSSFSSSLPWLAGYLPAFSAWYVSTLGVTGAGDSSGFFGGITGLLGTKDTSQVGGGNEYIGAGFYSNAPTMLQSVFAIDGALVAAVVVIGLGVLAHSAYRRALAGRTAGAAAYCAVVAMILWAPNSWFYGYGGRVLAVMMLLAAGIAAARQIRRAAMPARAIRTSRPRTPLRG